MWRKIGLLRLTTAVFSFCIGSGADASLPHADKTPSEAEQRTAWDRGQAAQRKFEHSLFTGAGFEPIAEVHADGHDVRRMIAQDPYMILPVPALELERLKNRQITLRVQYRGWSSNTLPVNGKAWDDLARQERAVFATAKFHPVQRNTTLSVPPPLCHGWIVQLEADYKRTASWAACGNLNNPVENYAIQMLKLAMATRPDCSFDDKNPFWSFNACFSPKPSLDDPNLEAKFSVLRKDFDSQPGADRLAEARLALNASAIALGNKGWLVARESVGRFAKVEQNRQNDLEQLQQLSNAALHASAPDRAKIGQTIKHWSEFLLSQESNYSNLVEQLVWPTGSSR